MFSLLSMAGTMIRGAATRLFATIPLVADLTFDDAVGILGTIVSALGAGVAIWGGINLMEGYGNDNPGAKSQGVKQLVAGGGIILIGTVLVPKLTGMLG